MCVFINPLDQREVWIRLIANGIKALENREYPLIYPGPITPEDLESPKDERDIN